jgi:hypothetical protein
MATVGDALDNAVAESFFATLECELLDRYPWPTRAGLRTAIFDFIEVFYNRQRRHSTLELRHPSHLRAAARISSTRSLTTVSTKAGQLQEDVRPHGPRRRLERSAWPTFRMCHDAWRRDGCRSLLELRRLSGL